MCNIEPNRGQCFVGHALSSHILITSGKVNRSDYAICKHGMVVTSWYEVDSIIKFHQLGYPLQTLPSKSTLIVASKGIDCSLYCHNNSMKSSTSNFVNFLFVERIWYYLWWLGWICLLIFNWKLFNFAQTNWAFGLALTGWVVILIGLTRSINV